ncbi:ROK family protein [Aureimonas frigidaquae]|uniref:Putative transcriptional regulator, xylose operon suppressor n=1 Tax=Aureimonas frigidaquae TaxID=424757 RepID=A0A0N7KY23_9HYPH|nr:ROK family protein [Aureimonas frigidaquae]BAT28521.1 putative transcriptional regulator, xylose operon suppressor [Aureimonas frigidaquae]
MLSKSDSEAVRRQNRRLAIEHFRQARLSTRRGLAAQSGLSNSGASDIVGDLVREGILVESAATPAAPRRGRPEISMSLNDDAARVAAVKVAVGEVTVTIAGYGGAILAMRQARVDLMTDPGAALAERIADMIGAGLSDCGAGGPLRHVVVAVQGVADAQNRRLLWSPVVGGRDIDLGGPIEERLGAPVLVMNDCGLMPERFRWSGEATLSNFATLFIGFGVGMGLRLHGSTFQGAHSSAVEFGHMNHIPDGAPCRCGKRGCIEAYAGDYAIWRAARGDEEAQPARRITDVEMRDLAEAARRGDARALAAFAQAGQALGYGLGRLFALIDPLPIVFVGSGALAMDLLEPSIRAAIGESAIAGSGADVPFRVYPDVDQIILEASVALALARVDDIHAIPAQSSVANTAVGF